MAISLLSLSMPESDSIHVVEGLATIPSRFGAKVTVDRLEAQIRAKGLNVFARVDHAAGAAEVGLPLASTELIIFGNARGGTPLIQSAQTVGIDLPLKALVWEDGTGKTWISYNEPKWIAQRHGIADQKSIVDKMADLLRDITTEAAGGR